MLRGDRFMDRRYLIINKTVLLLLSCLGCWWVLGVNQFQACCQRGSVIGHKFADSLDFDFFGYGKVSACGNDTGSKR